MQNFTKVLFLLLVTSFSLSGQMEEMIQEMIKEKSIAYKWAKRQNNPINTTRTVDETKITPNFTRTSQEGEPMICVNPKDPNHVLVSFMSFDAASFEIPIYVSFDGGLTWQLSEFNAQEFHTSDPSRAGLQILGGGDPMMVFDDQGTLFFTWIVLAAQQFVDGQWFNYGVVSNDGGLTFEEQSAGELIINSGELNLLTSQLGDNGDGIFDRHWIDVDLTDGPGNGNLYMAGLFFNSPTTSLPGPGMVVKRKLKGANNFEDSHKLLSPTAEAQFAQVKVDRDGNVHIVFGDLMTNELLHFVSKDQGDTYEGPHKIGTFTYSFDGDKTYHDRENPAPSLAINPVDGSLKVAWGSFNNGGQVYFSESYDLGSTWSPQMDLVGMLPDVYDGGTLPTIVVGENGVMSILFFGMRDLTGDYVHIQHDGDGFLPHEVVSAAETDFSSYSINDPFSETFFGDYYASAAAGCNGFGVFSDGRLGQGPKVYMATVDLCGELSAPRQVRFNDERFRVGLDGTVRFQSPDTGSGTLVLVSSSGVEIKNAEWSVSEGNNQVLLAQDLPTGVYAVQLRFNGIIYVTKWVKSE